MCGQASVGVEGGKTSVSGVGEGLVGQAIVKGHLKGEQVERKKY